MELCFIWEPQQICHHLSAPRTLFPYHCPTSKDERVIICCCVFMSESNYALGSILTTMVRNDILVVQSGFFFPLSNLLSLLILSIVHICQRLSSFGLCHHNNLGLLLSSVTPHSFSTSRGRNSSNVQFQTFAHLDIYSFL